MTIFHGDTWIPSKCSQKCLAIKDYAVVFLTLELWNAPIFVDISIVFVLLIARAALIVLIF